MGRPRVFDKDKRELLIGLVASGFTRRQAAEHVGISKRTVARALGEDEEFRRTLGNAELRLELHPMQHIRTQMTKEWRAAAWLLERQRPDLFARRAPSTVTLGDLRGIFGGFLQLLLEGVPDQSIRDRVRKNVETFLADLGGQQRCSPQVCRVLDKLKPTGPAQERLQADAARAPSAAGVDQRPASESSSVVEEAAELDAIGRDPDTTRTQSCHNVPQGDIKGQNAP